MMACALDVHYVGTRAQAAAVIFSPVQAEFETAHYREIIEPVEDYVSGEFFRRELPCLMKVVSQIQEPIDLFLIDGYVWLEDGCKGLGGRFHDALMEERPVIGVAKTAYRDASDTAELLRGGSKRPLFVSAIGMPLADAVSLVAGMAGEHRVPRMLQLVDQYSRH